ncbi:MAG: DUF6930 domain-containing protein [Planctomycetota bacterium]
MAAPKKPARSARTSAHDASPNTSEFLALVHAARAFQELAPWEWMRDESLLGVRALDARETDWCCVLGAARELHGLAVYVGGAGYDVHARLQDGELDRDDSLFEQDARLLSFVPKRMLSQDERRALDAAGVQFDARIGWPQFERHHGGTIGQPLASDEIPLLLAAIEQTIDVAQRVRAEPKLLRLNRAKRHLVRVESGTRPSTVWTDERQDAPPMPVAVVEPLETARLESVARRPRAAGSMLQVDVFPMYARIGDPELAGKVPAQVLVVDGVSGMVLHVDITPPDARFARTREELVKTLEKLGELPEVLQVTRPELAAWIEPVAEAIGAQVELVPFLDVLSEVRESLEEFLVRGGPKQSGRRQR